MEEVPLISWIQKLVLYETKHKYYVVGSNKAETRFRVLKIDRIEPKELVIQDEQIEYDKNEIQSLLSMIDGSNRPKNKNKGASSGMLKNVSAFGIAGFVRFLEGYYMILITKRNKVAGIGPHNIYKIEDTSMIYIPHDSVRQMHPDESRYVKMFQNVDLSSNFYFSYSYDVTHTLQYNMAPSVTLSENSNSNNNESKQREPTKQHTESKLQNLVDDLAKEAFAASGKSKDVSERDKEMKQRDTPQSETVDKSVKSEISTEEKENSRVASLKCGVKSSPCKKFLWNQHLLKGFEGSVHSDWILYIIHGFIGQHDVCVWGKSVYLTVIGRRSNKFAGTRFLKRGTNHQGFVANEIETEQIVQDVSTTFFDQTKISSFVQLRGSVPLFWSQDISTMVPKPPISLDQRDPYCSAAGMHFNQLLRRYGAPSIVLNLVKTREKRKHESILTEEFVKSIDYLNQFLPSQHNIQYIHFDMARVNKRKDADVMLRLNRIARYSMKQTGFFLSVPQQQMQYLAKDPELMALKGVWGDRGCRQTGAVRTNCVDCLDRTNTAQFAMGRSALAYQLYALGVLSKPHLEFDTDCVRLMEELYEDHGDTMALQYGGSQLVHRIKSYRKIAPLTSHGRDIMQTLSRYYSNAFSDLEKQQAFNLFLGVFVPEADRPNLWDLPTDYYLHNKITMGLHVPRNHYCQWWDSDVWESLPLPHDEVIKSQLPHVAVVLAPEHDEHVNLFFEHYQPEELTQFDDCYPTFLSNLAKKHIPKDAKDKSPFTIRQFYDLSLEKGPQPSKRRSELSNLYLRILYYWLYTNNFYSMCLKSEMRYRYIAESNPNISGKDSTSSSVGSEGSSDSSDSSDGGDGGVQLDDSSTQDESESDTGYVSFKDLLPSMKTVYDTEITEPDARDQRLYQRYVDIGCVKKEETGSVSDRLKSKLVQPGIEIYPISTFKLDTSFYVESPLVSRQSKEIYRAYVQRGKVGAGPVSEADRHAYIKYINKKCL